MIGTPQVRSGWDTLLYNYIALIMIDIFYFILWLKLLNVFIWYRGNQGEEFMKKILVLIVSSPVIFYYIKA